MDDQSSLNITPSVVTQNKIREILENLVADTFYDTLDIEWDSENCISNHLQIFVKI